MLALQNASIRKETRRLIEWELLTGSPLARPSAPLVRHYRHESREWRILDTFMKMNCSHTVPLSKQLRVLQIMEPVSRHRPWSSHPQTTGAYAPADRERPRLSAWGSAVNWSPTACAAAVTAGAGFFPVKSSESVLAHQKEDEIEAAYNRSATIWNKGDR